jgi:hypothetical protein
MKNENFTGIGCYAKPERLSRIFNKLVQAYTLGPFRGNQLFDGPKLIQLKDAALLHALMAGQTGDTCSGSAENPGFKVSRKITGFYLALNDQKLDLSIFARTNNSRAEIITTSLDGLTKLRQRRLH